MSDEEDESVVSNNIRNVHLREVVEISEYNRIKTNPQNLNYQQAHFLVEIAHTVASNTVFIIEITAEIKNSWIRGLNAENPNRVSAVRGKS